MNKTYCTKCGKEIEYEGFCCPTYCNKCESKLVLAIAEPTDTTIDREYGVHCIICNEKMKLTDREFEFLFCTGRVARLVCDKCKQAVMKMREQHEYKGE